MQCAAVCGVWCAVYAVAAFTHTDVTYVIFPRYCFCTTDCDDKLLAVQKGLRTIASSGGGPAVGSLSFQGGTFQLAFSVN